MAKEEQIEFEGEVLPNTLFKVRTLAGDEVVEVSVYNLTRSRIVSRQR